MSLQRFAGKVAVLTGATQGIGLATARRLGKEGCKVVVSSRRQANVDEAVDLLLKEGIDASGVTCHQGNPDDRQKLMKYAIYKHGGFDCLFLSAGVNPHFGSLLSVGEKEFNKVFDVNVKSNFMFIRESLPHLIKRGGGSIVTNATAAAGDFGMAFMGRVGHERAMSFNEGIVVFGERNTVFTNNLRSEHNLARGVRDLALDIRLYAVSKLTLAAVTGHVARDCFNQNVRVNCVLPGIINTQFVEGGVPASSFFAHMDVYGIGHNDLAGRRGEPDDVSGVVAFLLSDDAAYMSGQCIGCAGGFGLVSYIF